MRCGVKFYCLLGWLGLIGTSAKAANEHGNGGDVLVCQDAAGGQTVELLDFWEARELRGQQPDFRNIPFRERAVFAMMEILNKDQNAAVRFMRWADQFMDETVFLENVDLPDINDSGDLLLPNNCDIKQIAIQVTPQTSHDKRYRVDRRLWDQLDENNKAGLIIHEVIYRDALRRGQLNSVNTRKFVGLIISKTLNTYNADTVQLGFREYVYKSEHFLYRLLEDIVSLADAHTRMIDFNNENMQREFFSEDNAINNYLIDLQRTNPSSVWDFPCRPYNEGWWTPLSQSCYSTGTQFHYTPSNSRSRQVGRLAVFLR